MIRNLKILIVTAIFLLVGSSTAFAQLPSISGTAEGTYNNGTLTLTSDWVLTSTWSINGQNGDLTPNSSNSPSISYVNGSTDNGIRVINLGNHTISGTFKETPTYFMTLISSSTSNIQIIGNTGQILGTTPSPDMHETIAVQINQSMDSSSTVSQTLIQGVFNC